MKVLFLCMGNICRSPLAEALARDRIDQAGLSEWVTVDSAGTEPYHVGQPPDPRACRVGRSAGVELETLRARQIGPPDLQAFDLILAMDRVNLRALEALAARYPGTAQRSLYLPWIGYAERDEVPDPYYGDLSDFQAVHDLLASAADRLVERLRERTG